jgi:hypothetical protein
MKKLKMHSKVFLITLLICLNPILEVSAVEENLYLVLGLKVGAT